MKINKEDYYYFMQVGTKRHYQAKQLIYLQEEDSNSVYLIIKGRVRVFEITNSGKELTYDILDEGFVFGESAFYGTGIRMVSVEAINDVDLIECDMEKLIPIIYESKKITMQLFTMMSETNAHVTRLLKWSRDYNSHEKLAAFLYELTMRNNKNKELMNGYIPYSHEDFSSSIGLNRVTVSKVLKDFQNQGLIIQHYKAIQVINRDLLYKLYLEDKK